jgi:hypothetical protein
MHNLEEKGSLGIPYIMLASVFKAAASSIFQPWFHGSWSRQQAEDVLSRVNTDGAFLVRVGERVPNSFAITFIAEKKIKHCLVKQVPML